jgi:carboxymethylenebutenolidase
VQVGLLDPTKLPVSGAEQAAKLRDPTLPSNELIHRAARQKA